MQLGIETMRSFVNIGKTGFLRESVTAHPTPKGFSVYPTMHYAKFVDKGTNPHWIFPKHATVLRWETELGAVIFAKKVFHPGYVGSHFVKKTRDFLRLELHELLKGILERVYER